MRFVLVDRITSLRDPANRWSPSRIFRWPKNTWRTTFPGFPVMPGVLMLEALTQAGAWLVRDMEDFAHSVVVLKKAKMIKYGSFVEPGRQLQLKVTLVSHDDSRGQLQGGRDDRWPIDGQGAVHVDAIQPPRPRPGALHATDASIVAGLRDLFATLSKGSVGARAMFKVRSRRSGPTWPWSSGP